VVNPDSIRLALYNEAFISSAEPFVWAIAKCMVKALFIAGHKTVILDATNTTIGRQDDWNGVAEDINATVKFKVFRTHAIECMERATNDNKEFLIPVIQRMALNWEDPPTEMCL
jgi:predicted kinase